MGPWVLAAAACAVLALVLVCSLAVRATRRRRAELARQLVAARNDVLALTDRLEALSDEVEEQRRLVEETRSSQEAAPFVITGLVQEPEVEVTPREAQIVQAIEASKPQWVPAAPFREALVKTLAFGHGVRRALAPVVRDRIFLEMKAEVRRSRRQRKAEMRAVRKYLRDRRKSAA